MLFPGANIDNAIDGATLVEILCYFQTTVMFTIYGIAVALGHVPVWMPMISDCMCRIPETWIARIGFIWCALLMGMSSSLYRGYLDSVLPTLGLEKTWHFTSNRILMWLAFGACLFLSILTSVNELEDNRIHSVSAVIFFLLYFIYMVINNIMLLVTPGLVTKKSMIVKTLVCVFYISVLVILGVLSGNWGAHKPWIAVCEWLAVFSILAYNATFVHEFRGFMYQGIFNVVSSKNLAVASTMPSARS